MSYNPFNLLEFRINGQIVSGRPYEFDSEIANQETQVNAFGNIVKPIKAVTICPDCGNGIDMPIKLDDPPFPIIDIECPVCSPAPPELVDPFINPVSAGRVPAQDLDPILRDPNQPLTSSDIVTVIENPIPIEVKPPKEKSSRSKKKKPTSIRKKVATEELQFSEVDNRELADELTEEVDFDDSGMLDE